ncbi:MAG: GlsB/YeaQ/YmgE family stress response membrane protein [Ramlibacter sp.]|nr:GlsB/YeaQ/YmgE family stress response membrane protein [Ramlibacter sp.]
MSILTTILVGFVVGLLARALKPGNDSMGIIFTTLVGIAGAMLAKYAGVALGLYHEGEPIGWIASVIGAIVLLVVVGLVRGRSSRF